MRKTEEKCQQFLLLVICNFMEIFIHIQKPYDEFWFSRILRFSSYALHILFLNLWRKKDVVTTPPVITTVSYIITYKLYCQGRCYIHNYQKTISFFIYWILFFILIHELYMSLHTIFHYIKFDFLICEI